MKTQRTWPYLSLAALMGLASCTSSRQTAQNAGEMDDLYGSSANAVVYEGNRQSSQPSESIASTRSQRQRERDAYARNTNPDYINDDQRGYDPNRDEYYTELSTRNVKRGLSADPGWNTGSYNDGFTDGYYAGIGNPAFNSTRWNPWGWNNGFNTGLSIGLGVGSGFGWGSPWGWNSFNRFGYGGFYDPFWGGGYNSFAYSPWGYGGGFYDPFWGGGFNRFGYGGFGYSPWGGGWNRPVIVSNTIITGADPYRATRTYGARGSASNSRYNDNFNNTPRNYNPRGTGGRTATGSAAPVYGNNTNTGTSTGSSDSYYARPRNTRGTYYYESGANNTGSRGGNTSSGTYTDPNGRTGSGSSGGYYSAPRENSRGTYTPRSGNSTYESRPSYNQPSYQAPQRSTYESRPSYSQPSQSSTPSYSAPSSGGSRGGSSGGYSGGGGGGSRGPR